MTELIFGVDPFEEKPVATEKPSGELQFDKPLPKITPQEEIVEQVVKPLTPKAMGRYLEQKMLPRIEEEKKKAEAERSNRLGAAQMQIGHMDPWMQKALATAGSAANTMTAGVFPYIPAAMAKGAGMLGVPGYERYGSMPLVDVKKEAQKRVSAASTVHPGYGFAGSVAGIPLGAVTTPTIAASRGPMLSGALTGGVYSGVAGAAEEGNIGDAIKGAIIGTIGGGVAAPIIERVASGILRTFKGGKPVVNEYGVLTEEAIEIARKAGLSNEQIIKLAPQLREVFEQRGLTQSAAREAPFREFGVTPTRGMVTRDPKQLAREKEYGTSAVTAAGAPAAAEAITGSPAPLTTVREAMDAAIASGNAAAKRLKDQYEKAYGVAEIAPGKFDRESISNLGDKIMKRFGADPKTLNVYTNELAQRAAADLDKVLGAKIATETPGVSVIHTTFRGVEGARQMLNQYLGAAQTNADRSAIRSLITSFDRKIEDNINSGLFSGDRKVLGDWKTARKLYSEYQKKFGIKKTGEDAGRLFKSVIDGNRNSDEVGNLMFNIAASGDAKLKAGAGRYYRELQRALGPNSPELVQIKNSYIKQVVQPVASGKDGAFLPKDFANVAKNINAMLIGTGSSFSRAALSNVERQALLRYADIMKTAAIENPEVTRNKILQWGKRVAAAAPAVASGIGWALMNLEPKVAATLAAIGSIPGAVSAVKGAGFAQQRLANRPPPTEARSYRFPATRSGLTRAAIATPTIDEQIGDFVEERPGRATGGSVKGAVNLRALANAARKQVTQSTEEFLKESDSEVAKALEVANQHI